ncbi:predicted protein [Lichtheimia corymbifera JMRC:FSU:9682]|uniref:Uncharacterized protein n=1 Tax=Lichtheimia corymbifera JMRC:FSU:9682 TaxID=1263082 RepID=A0A068RP74_9FUNG|nr:predicted protein [Lichtheimia corymbifera JMRC:FSU:9682]
MWDPTTQVTPRQIAYKAHTLARKKLNQSHYDIRQRVLLCNTIHKANVLLKHPSHLSCSPPVVQEASVDYFSIHHTTTTTAIIPIPSPT